MSTQFTGRIVVISAGMSDASSSTLLAGQIATAIGRASMASIESVELRPLAHDVIDASITGFASPRLQHVHDLISAADGVVVVSPIYQASYSGLFKAFFDGLDSEAMVGKVVLVAATGGTARHSLALDLAMRPLFSYLQTVIVPTGVFASPHDWGGEGAGALASRVERAAGEMLSLLGGGGSGRTVDDDIDLFSETMLSISDPNRD